MTKFLKDTKSKISILSTSISVVKGGKAVIGFGGNKTTVYLIEGTPFTVDKSYEELMDFLEKSDAKSLEATIKEPK